MDLTHHDDLRTDLHAVDSRSFRSVLTHYPTGVVLVTGAPPAPGQLPPAMVLGTFTSVSLHPPLVGFLAAKSSSTWPLIRPSGWLCVNVLAADQLRVSLRFTAKHPLRWDVPHRFRPSGAPQLLDALAWIDGQIAAETDAGDHWFVSVHVRSLDIQRVTEPLLFVRGSYAAPRPLAGGVTPLGTA